MDLKGEKKKRTTIQKVGRNISQQSEHVPSSQSEIVLRMSKELKIKASEVGLVSERSLAEDEVGERGSGKIMQVLKPE